MAKGVLKHDTIVQSCTAIALTLFYNVKAMVQTKLRLIKIILIQITLMHIKIALIIDCINEAPVIYFVNEWVLTCSLFLLCHHFSWSHFAGKVNK